MTKLRYALIFILGLFFFSVLLSASVRNIYLSDSGGEERLGFIAKPIKFMAEVPSLIKRFMSAPEFYVSNDDSKNGFTYLNGKPGDSFPKLLVSYKLKPFEQEFELLDINTGASLKRWTPDNQDLFDKAYNEKNTKKPQKGSDLYFMHPYMDADSSLIFNSQLTSLLVKINAKSEILWLKNDRTYHHTVEPDHLGRIYSCSVPFESGKYDFLPGKFEDYSATLLDDHITLLDKEDGTILFDKSVIEILVENGFKELLLYKGQAISDPIHLNDIQPALNDGDFWEKGDLLISCRNISTVFLYRPSTNKILWLKHGPWMNQHDVDYKGKNEIVVFGNDVIREESRIDPPLTEENLTFSIDRSHNEVYIYNFEKDSVYTPFTSLLENEEVRTITSGRCDILENGDLYVEETNQGRILIGDSTQKKIEYVKRIDEKNISSLFWSRIVY